MKKLFILLVILTSIEIHAQISENEFQIKTHYKLCIEDDSLEEIKINWIFNSKDKTILFEINNHYIKFNIVKAEEKQGRFHFTVDNGIDLIILSAPAENSYNIKYLANGFTTEEGETAYKNTCIFTNYYSTSFLELMKD